jgi:FkbM family methyltransferase
VGAMMNKKIKNILKSILKKFDIGIINASTLEKLLSNASDQNDIEFLLKMPPHSTSSLLKYFRKSKSQIRQDLFVLTELNFKTNGFFVEFGATNGINLSNSHLMEKEFGWKGILAEPAKCWHKDLKKNRVCNIETRCLWKDSFSTLTFNEVEIAELSTLNNYSGSDLHKEARKNGKTYDVTTISLNDLLEKYDAPRVIDYLSIDTEGSEFEILSHFDFSKYSFNVITCEHNFTLMRDKLYGLLSSYGYVRVYQEISQFDDWYVKASQ